MVGGPLRRARYLPRALRGALSAVTGTVLKTGHLGGPGERMRVAELRPAAHSSYRRPYSLQAGVRDG